MREQKEIALSNLTVDTAQSRRQGWDGDESDQRLVNSLEQDGILHPLLVRPISCASYGDDVDEDYAIIAGSRRYRAAVRAGFTTVRCLVTDADDATAAEKSLRENRDRKDLSDAEVADSLRLQFELLRPPETTECPGDCDYIIKRDNSTGAINHLSGCDANLDAHTDNVTSDYSQGDFILDNQVVSYLALRHFGDNRRNVERNIVSQYLEIAELPDDLQALWESENSLTAEQKQALSDIELSQELSVSSGSGGLSNEVVQLHKEVAESSDSVDSTRAVLEVVSKLEAVDVVDSQKTLSEKLSDYTEKVSEQLEANTDLNDSAVISETIESHASKLAEMSTGINSSGSIHSSEIVFDEPKYHRWHAKVKQARGIKADSATVREAYREYLEEMADEHGWN